MFRYLAFVWNPSDSSDPSHAQSLVRRVQEMSPTWSSVFDAPGIHCYTSVMGSKLLDSHLLPDSKGVVIGSIFRRGDSSKKISLGADDGNRVAASAGRFLVNHYWGQYISIVHDPQHRTTSVFRDPSGQVRCFRIRHGRIWLFCSHVEDVADLGVRFSVNWNYIGAELAHCAAMGWEQTGLQEVSAVCAGECFEVHGENTRSDFFWNPLQIATDTIESPATAVSAIRDTVRECVRTWAKHYSDVVLLLSGGLDSTIILSCMQDMPNRPALTCLNVHYPCAYADERAFARAAADYAKCKLVERQRPSYVDLRSLLELPALARPSEIQTDYTMSMFEWDEFARARRATALFTGNMGDQLFGQRLGIFGFSDYVWMHGMRAAAWTAAADVANTERLSLWRVIMHGIPHGVRMKLRAKLGLRPMLDFQGHVNPLVRPETLKSLEYNLLQKWLCVVDSVPAGKIHHICDIMSAQAYFTHVARHGGPDWITPLYSQPIMELCLRLPVYILIRGGWDRSVARRAFASDIPRMIAIRRPKGAHEGQRSDVLRANAEFVRELLLNGILVQRGILDRDLLARVLSDPTDDLNTPALDQCLKVETWLRSWSAHQVEV